MPCQRAKDKVRLGGYIERDLYLEILAEASGQGREHNKFGFVIQLMREALGSSLPAPKSVFKRRKPSRDPAGGPLGPSSHPQQARLAVSPGGAAQLQQPHLNARLIAAQIARRIQAALSRSKSQTAPPGA